MRLKSMLGGKRPSAVGRVYAIGDIHGRFDLFQRLIGLIETDQARRQPVPTWVVLLGDIIDRGPDSAKVVRACMRLTGRNLRLTVLKGNHEALMVAALDGDFDALRHWLTLGGDATLRSFGVPESMVCQGGTVALLEAARAAVGQPTRAWLKALPLTYRFDRYCLVHAGVRPGRRLSRQREEDLLWIRDEFLESEMDHGAIIIHGHTVVEHGPDIRHNRIGIDTGAFRTGRLTALGLEPNDVWSLTTEPAVAQKLDTATLQPSYLDQIARQQSGNVTAGGV